MRMSSKFAAWSVRGQVDQKSAQAATWHYTDKLSWDFLASKVGYESIGGSKVAHVQS